MSQQQAMVDVLREFAAVLGKKAPLGSDVLVSVRAANGKVAHLDQLKRHGWQPYMADKLAAACSGGLSGVECTLEVALMPMQKLLYAGSRHRALKASIDQMVGALGADLGEALAKVGCPVPVRAIVT